MPPLPIARVLPADDDDTLVETKPPKRNEMNRKLVGVETRGASVCVGEELLRIAVGQVNRKVSKEACNAWHRPPAPCRAEVALLRPAKQMLRLHIYMCG